MRLLYLILICHVLQVKAQTLSIPSPFRLLSLGDSYTIGEGVAASQRWPVQLRDSLTSRGFKADTLEVIAKTGWRTDNLLTAISGKQLHKKKFNLVSLLIGVNNQFQGANFSTYKKEFAALVDSCIRFAGNDKSKVFIVSIPDYAYTPFGQQSPKPDTISAQIDRYNMFNKNYADSMKISYFNITPISREGLNKPSYVASDGLHPSGTQYAEWVKLMMKSVVLPNIAGLKVKKNDFLLKVAPNPIIDELTLHISQKGPYEVALYNTLGKEVRTINGAANNIKLDLSALADGIYIIRILHSEETYYHRIIKSSE